MKDVHVRASARNNFVIRFLRPRIERELDGDGWLVHRGSHAWLAGDRDAALREFKLLGRIERTGSYRPKGHQ
jgi:hypothetical protein